MQSQRAENHVYLNFLIFNIIISLIHTHLMMIIVKLNKNVNVRLPRYYELPTNFLMLGLLIVKFD